MTLKTYFQKNVASTSPLFLSLMSQQIISLNLGKTALKEAGTRKKTQRAHG